REPWRGHERRRSRVDAPQARRVDRVLQVRPGPQLRARDTVPRAPAAHRSQGGGDGGTMSSTNRGGERRPLDAYYTPTELADAIVRRLVVDGMIERSRALRVLEPHAGEGAWIRALRLQLPGAHITANDIVDSVSRWRACGADA